MSTLFFVCISVPYGKITCNFCIPTYNVWRATSVPPRQQILSLWSRRERVTMHSPPQIVERNGHCIILYELADASMDLSCLLFHKQVRTGTIRTSLCGTSNTCRETVPTMPPAGDAAMESPQAYEGEVAPNGFIARQLKNPSLNNTPGSRMQLRMKHPTTWGRQGKCCHVYIVVINALPSLDIFMFMAICA